MAMLSKLNPLTVFRNQYFFFITTVIVTIIVNQVIIQYDLSEQNEDAKLINLAGRQRMLSQRIAKRAMYTRDILRDDSTSQAGIDTLRNLITTFEKVHFDLLQGHDAAGKEYRKSWHIDSLLEANTPHLVAIVSAARQLCDRPNYETAKKSVAIISQNELQFLMMMEKTVATYQAEAERKLKRIKRIELMLAGVSLLTLLLEMFFIFRPMIQRLRTSNRELMTVNGELETINEELKSSEELVRSNFDYITELQKHLESSEAQFRQLVEGATDMIYELDERGKFVFVNPVMLNITEYEKPELLSMFYWDVIPDEHRERVTKYYAEQRRLGTEYSYLELPIHTRSGFEVWVGQNVRMFRDKDAVLKISVVARDITVLHNANRALLNSERLFRTLTQNSPVGIYQLDEKGNVTFINDQWFEIVGLDARTATREARCF